MKTIIEFVRPWVGEFFCARCGTSNKPRSPFFPSEKQQHIPCISCGQMATIYQLDDSGPSDCVVNNNG